MKKVIALLSAFGLAVWWGSGWFADALQPAPESEAPPEIVSIATLTNQPRDYSGQVVRVAGRIVGSASIWVRGYVLQDSTGHITVTTERAVPPRGQRVIVTGTAQQLIKIGHMQLFHLEEEHLQLRTASGL